MTHFPGVVDLRISIFIYFMHLPIFFTQCLVSGFFMLSVNKPKIKNKYYGNKVNDQRLNVQGVDHCSWWVIYISGFFFSFQYELCHVKDNSHCSTILNRLKNRFIFCLYMLQNVLAKL